MQPLIPKCPACGHVRVLPVSGAWTCIECWHRWPRPEEPDDEGPPRHLVEMAERIVKTGKRATSAWQWTLVLKKAFWIVAPPHVAYTVWWWCSDEQYMGKFGNALTAVTLLVMSGRSLVEWLERRTRARFFATMNDALQQIDEIKGARS